MKKIIAFAAISMIFAAQAYAGDSIGLSLTATGKSVYGAKTGATASATTPLIGKTSTGVGVGIKTSAVGYSAETQHKNGTKAYGSAHDSTSMYVKDVTAGTADTTSLGTGANTFASPWTTM